jgi:membrane protein YdbS with pleckstrin-like domain
MLFAELLTGIILIFCGLLVKYNPNLIAGYNTMSEKEKKTIDVTKLSTMMRNYLVIIGALVILIGIILFLLDVKQSIRLMSISVIVILGVMLMVFNGQSFKKE